MDRLRLLGRLRPETTALLVCDIQTRFRDLIYKFDSVAHTARLMIKASKILSMPVIATEQYPKALGRTIPELEITPETHSVFEKTQFSMCTPEVLTLLRSKDIKSAILCGIEAHVCVQQTALHLLEQGIDCHVLADGVSSQRTLDRSVALTRMSQAGAFVTTAESALFELMRDATHPRFREVSGLLKEHNESRPVEDLSRL